MSTMITDPATGEEVLVWVIAAHGYVDAMVRADSKDAWEQAALSNRLLVKHEDGTVAPFPGVHIDAIGPVVLQPAELDENGNAIVPAVLDERYHVNFRLRDDLDWQSVAIAWMVQGSPDPDVNSDEAALVLASVALIDPETISTPVRVWA